MTLEATNLTKTIPLKVATFIPAAMMISMTKFLSTTAAMTIIRFILERSSYLKRENDENLVEEDDPDILHRSAITIPTGCVVAP